MKKSTINSAPLLSRFTIGCLLIVALTLNQGCNKMEPEAPSNVLMVQKSNDFLLHDVDVTSQLVVWKKPDSSLSSFNKWIKKFNNKYQTPDGKGVQQEYCKCCDST